MKHKRKLPKIPEIPRLDLNEVNSKSSSKKIVLKKRSSQSVSNMTVSDQEKNTILLPPISN